VFAQYGAIAAARAQRRRCSHRSCVFPPVADGMCQVHREDAALTLARPDGSTSEQRAASRRADHGRISTALGRLSDDEAAEQIAATFGVAPGDSPA
jgi:hypothetical protein